MNKIKLHNLSEKQMRAISNGSLVLSGVLAGTGLIAALGTPLFSEADDLDALTPSVDDVVETDMFDIEVDDAASTDSYEGDASYIEVDTDIPVDTYDELSSFGEAFRTARDTYGKDGLFEWEGKTYTTLYKEELDGMEDVDVNDYSGRIIDASNTEEYTIVDSGLSADTYMGDDEIEEVETGDYSFEIDEAESVVSDTYEEAVVEVQENQDFSESENVMYDASAQDAGNVEEKLSVAAEGADSDMSEELADDAGSTLDSMSQVADVSVDVPEVAEAIQVNLADFDDDAFFKNTEMPTSSIAGDVAGHYDPADFDDPAFAPDTDIADASPGVQDTELPEVLFVNQVTDSISIDADTGIADVVSHADFEDDAFSLDTALADSSDIPDFSEETEAFAFDSVDDGGIDNVLSQSDTAQLVSDFDFDDSAFDVETAVADSTIPADIDSIHVDTSDIAGLSSDFDAHIVSSDIPESSSDFEAHIASDIPESSVNVDYEVVAEVDTSGFDDSVFDDDAFDTTGPDSSHIVHQDTLHSELPESTGEEFLGDEEAHVSH